MLNVQGYKPDFPLAVHLLDILTATLRVSGAGGE